MLCPSNMKKYLTITIGGCNPCGECEFDLYAVLPNVFCEQLHGGVYVVTTIEELMTKIAESEKEYEADFVSINLQPIPQEFKEDICNKLAGKTKPHWAIIT